MQVKDKFLIVVGGPTASGKTRFAIDLAKHFDTVVLSSDSRQFFREINIGTAKPTPEELSEVKHYFIDHLGIQEEYSIGAFEREALALLEKLYLEHDVVILAGGSGMYIKALCEGLDNFPEVPAKVKFELRNWYEQKGLEPLQKAVAEKDPIYFAEVDQQNPHRLLRALEVMEVSGQPFSSFRKSTISPRPFFSIYLWLDWPRAELYDRINLRVDLMVEQGLIEEAKSLFEKRAYTALQTVGYQELFEALEGKINEAEAIELIKRNSRRYAKRQLTWSRRDGFWKHIQKGRYQFGLAYLKEVMEKKWKIKETDLGIRSKSLEIYNQEFRMSLIMERYKTETILKDFQSNFQEPAILRFLFHEAQSRIHNQPNFTQLPKELGEYFNV